MSWKGEISTKDVQFNRLLFADDMVLIANSTHGMHEMQKLKAQNNEVGLKNNTSKTEPRSICEETMSTQKKRTVTLPGQKVKK